MAAALGRGGQALGWSGTFHAIGARLVRQHARDIGLDPAFTILDREDAAGLIDLVRHGLGFSRLPERFPRKATCLAIYSRAVNAERRSAEVLAAAFPWCADWEPELRKLFADYVDAKQRQNVLDYDDLLLYWAQMMEAPLLPPTSAAASITCWSTNIRTPTACRPDPAAPEARRRGLTVVGDDAQSIYSFRAATVRNILDFPNAFSPPARRSSRSSATIARRSRSLTRHECCHRSGERALHQELCSHRALGRDARSSRCADEAEQAHYVAPSPRAREAGLELKAAGRAVPRRYAVART